MSSAFMAMSGFGAADAVGGTKTSAACFSMPASPVNALSAALTGVSQLVRQTIEQPIQQLVAPVGAAQSRIITISIIIPGGGAGL